MAAVTALFLAVPLLGASCGDDGDTGATLPAIVTTTTSTTVVVTTTFIATYYEVKRGDNLGNIARVHGVDMAELMALNDITNPNEIEAGQELLIPPQTVP
jgi:LysM repeat protein